MILEQYVEVKITSKSSEHYKSLGYEIEYHIDRSGTKRLKQKLLRIPANHLPLNSKVVVKAKCDNCEKAFEKEYCYMAKNKVQNCSSKCMGEYNAKAFLKKFELLVGGDAKEFLYQKYVIEQKTTREIAKIVYGRSTGASTICRWLKTLGIELRHGGEAVKTQWINNNARRKQNAKLVKEIFFTEEALANREIAINTPESKQRQKFHKTGVNNPMYGVRGEEHPRWDDNITDEERISGRKTVEDVEWRKAVYKRDRYTCQACGGYHKIKVNAHHYLNHKTHKHLRYDVNNGVTVCEECHVQFHKTYGYFDNTKEQFLEFQNSCKPSLA